jgi:GDPmannose 4,6-dehydratase
MPTAVITGINGQDGSYLAEFLLSKGYGVVGTVPDKNSELEHILHIRESLEIIETSLLDQDLVNDVVHTYKPDEIYNLAARSSSNEFWSQPARTGELNALAVTRLLDGIRRIDPKIRFFQASSSEVFGNATEVPQTETTPFHPRNPYGVAKAFGHWTTVIYREYRGLFACSGILYNHESPRRGLEFVTRKISHTVAKIKLGLAQELRLGDLEAKRDWGLASDYTQAMWLSLQQPVPDDYIIATGEAHSVSEFCDIAFSHVGLNYQDYVVQGPEFVRTAETSRLVGNPTKAKRLLNWKPSVTFRELVTMMVEADMKALQNSHQQLTPMLNQRC